MKKEDTDKIFYAITCNGCRDMDEIRFHQAVNEALERVNYSKANVNGWNHRILAHKDGEDWFFQIHEVYYDDEGNPNSYTANGVSVGAESIEAINWILDKMKECANKPILSAYNFPNEWSSNGG